MRHRRAAEADLEKQKNLLEREQRPSQKDRGKKGDHSPGRSKHDRLTVKKVDESSSRSKEAASSIPEELLEETQSTSAAASKSSVHEEITSTSSAVPKIISEEIETTETPWSKDRRSAATTIPSEYRQDTFESLEGTTSLTRTNFLSHHVATSTPSSGHARNQMSSSARRPLELNGVMEDDDVTVWSEGKSAWTSKVGFNQNQ